jgi:hypothetical protein
LTSLEGLQLFPSNLTACQNNVQGDFLEYTNVKTTMSVIQPKMKHADYGKKQDSTIHDEENNPSIGTDPALTWMLQLVEKEIRTVW